MPAPIGVADTRADREETIQNIAKAIGRSAGKRRVFEAVYKGQRRMKSVADLIRMTGFGQVKVLQLGGELAANGAFHQVKGKDGLTAYEKDKFVVYNRERILNYVSHPNRLVNAPTKSNLGGKIITIKVAAPPRNKVKVVTIEDLDCF